MPQLRQIGRSTQFLARSGLHPAFGLSALTRMQLEQSPFQDQLVRGLTHRMNNILTLFHGYVGILLENEQLDQPTRDGLCKIRDGATAASELMDRTHSLVRPSTVVWRQIDLAEFVPMLRMVFEEFRKPTTQIQIKCAAEIPPVWADAGRLKTAIVELVRNACEAVSEERGTVRIEVRPEHSLAASGDDSRAQPKWINVSVVDNGPGIAPDMEEKVFQPFFSTKKRQNAAGLGLNVATGLVEQLGGAIRHHSAPGQTCFEVLLPAHPDGSAGFRS